GSAERMGAGQDVRVGCVAPAVLLGSQHVVAESPQLLDHPEGEILIGVELRPGSLHQSLFALFVLPNSAVNLLLVSVVIPPCGFRVGGSEGRVTGGGFPVGPPQPSIVDQAPDGNPGAPDAGAPAAAVRPLLNPGGSGFCSPTAQGTQNVRGVGNRCLRHV